MVENLAAIHPDRVHRSSRRALTKQLAVWARRNGFEHVPTSALLNGVKWWTRLHGIVSLEIEGNWASMGIDPNLLFDSEVDALPTD